MNIWILPLSAIVAIATVTMTTSASKILLIPVPHYSNVKLHVIAHQALKDNGHDVTVLVNDRHMRMVADANITHYAYILTPDTDVTSVAENMLIDLINMEANNFYKGYYVYSTLRGLFDRFCNQFLGNTEIMQFVEESKFDLVILDTFPLHGCMQYIPYKFGMKYMNLGPHMFPWMHGVSSVPWHEPPIMLELKSAKMNFQQRIFSLFAYVVIENILLFGPLDKYSSLYVPEKPFKSVKELFEETEMTLLTTETGCFDFPKISAPHYRFIGSLSGSVCVKPLPQIFEHFAESATDGLIVISFGSMTRLRKMIVKPIRMLLDALGRMKEKAILQFTIADLAYANIPPNVLVKEWLPQTDLLGHTNTKLFISHGGLNSHLEATHLAVPILTLPFQGEQARNGARAEAKGHGKLLKWEETNAFEIYETMREIIDNKSYKNSIAKCSAILKDMPSSRDQLVFWVNHILKHGSEHLQPLSMDLPFYQFFGLDVFAVLMIAFTLISGMLFACLKCCLRKCCKSSTTSKQKLQ